MLRFNLIAMVRRSRPALARSGRTIILPEITPTGVLIGNLSRLYMRLINSWWVGSRDQLLPAYRRALDQSAPRPGVMLDEENVAPVNLLEQVMEEVSLEQVRLTLDLTRELRGFTLDVERWHRMRWGAALQPQGITLQTLLTPVDVADTLEVVLRQNVSLVRNVSDQIRRRIEQVIYTGFTNRTPTRTIARDLSAAIGMERRRALRIAIDQTVKLSSQLDTERMKQAGIDEFQWIHSRKINFRPEHKARDGKIYKFSDPPEDMPGEKPFCGCTKRAVLTLK